MEALVLYDSTYGNTAQIAQAIIEAIGGQALLADEVSPADLNGLDLLIVGSPTHGGWFTEGIRDLLEASPGLEGASSDLALSRCPALAPSPRARDKQSVCPLDRLRREKSAGHLPQREMRVVAL